jgi:serine/threonine-protein kinase ULK/ATG1
MLIVDSKQRISWDDLFRHEIHSYQEDKIKKDLELTLKGDDMINNMSKFYIKNNMVENIYIYHKQKVIDHPAEIKKKEDLNNFAM